LKIAEKLNEWRSKETIDRSVFTAVNRKVFFWGGGGFSVLGSLKKGQQAI